MCRSIIRQFVFIDGNRLSFLCKELERENCRNRLQVSLFWRTLWVSGFPVSRVLNNPNYKCSSLGLREKIWKTAVEHLIQLGHRNIAYVDACHKGIVRMEPEGKLMIRNSCTEMEESMWSDYNI